MELHNLAAPEKQTVGILLLSTIPTCNWDTDGNCTNPAPEKQTVGILLLSTLLLQVRDNDGTAKPAAPEKKK
jgi:hypothetical protein